MKPYLTIAAIAATLTLCHASASAEGYYGYAPLEVSADEINAVGTGKNSMMEAAIKLDPATDPLLADLTGRRITAVRCYLRSDYKQARKGFSGIRVYQGTLDAVASMTKADFVAGWNTVQLDSPVEIGSDPIYIGYQVYETQGDPYPLASYTAGGRVSISGSCLINPGRKGWEEYSDHGCLMIQAVVDGDDSVMWGHVMTGVSGMPMVVVPDARYGCVLHIHNQGPEPVTSVSYASYDSDGNMLSDGVAEFATPIAAYGSANVDCTLRAPVLEGSSVPVYVTATAVNGSDSKKSRKEYYSLYVSSDVFNRIPLIEEFTGLACSNCPFMAYYLDEALESWAHPYAYVARHAGFVNDILTKPCDESLLYLFGDGGTYNPAVMYDRRVFEGSTLPVSGASVPSSQPYIDNLRKAMTYPAHARLLVSEVRDGLSRGCRIQGRIGRAALDFIDRIRLSVYLVEDSIPLSKYKQLGLDPLPDGAPADLLERLRHRGVIRHQYTSDNLGDIIDVDEEGNFTIDYKSVAINPEWDASKCEVIAILAKVDKDDLRENFVLNAGMEKYNEYVGSTSIASNTVGHQPFEVTVDADGRIIVADDVTGVRVFGISGCEYSSDASLPSGCYIVSGILPDGTVASCKVVIRL